MNKLVRNMIGVSLGGIVVASASACGGESANAGAIDTASVAAVETASLPAVETANASAVETNKPIAIKVYKTPQCGCCKAWVDHLSENGFQVEAMDMPDLSLVKQKYGVKRALESCHTGVVNGYVVEGHVPVAPIKRMLLEKPSVKGISLPGMPQGSPGMSGAKEGPFEILSISGGEEPAPIYAKE